MKRPPGLAKALDELRESVIVDRGLAIDKISRLHESASVRGRTAPIAPEQLAALARMFSGTKRHIESLRDLSRVRVLGANLSGGLKLPANIDALVNHDLGRLKSSVPLRWKPQIPSPGLKAPSVVAPSPDVQQMPVERLAAEHPILTLPGLSQLASSAGEVEIKPAAEAVSGEVDDPRSNLETFVTRVEPAMDGLEADAFATVAEDLARPPVEKGRRAGLTFTIPSAGIEVAGLDAEAIRRVEGGLAAAEVFSDLAEPLPVAIRLVEPVPAFERAHASGWDDFALGTSAFVAPLPLPPPAAPARQPAAEALPVAPEPAAPTPDDPALWPPSADSIDLVVEAASPAADEVEALPDVDIDLGNELPAEGVFAGPAIEEILPQEEPSVGLAPETPGDDAMTPPALVAELEAAPPDTPFVLLETDSEEPKPVPAAFVIEAEAPPLNEPARAEFVPEVQAEPASGTSHEAEDAAAPQRAPIELIEDAHAASRPLQEPAAIIETDQQLPEGRALIELVEEEEAPHPEPAPVAAAKYENIEAPPHTPAAPVALVGEEEAPHPEPAPAAAAKYENVEAPPTPPAPVALVEEVEAPQPEPAPVAAAKYENIEAAPTPPAPVALVEEEEAPQPALPSPAELDEPEAEQPSPDVTVEFIESSDAAAPAPEPTVEFIGEETPKPARSPARGKPSSATKLPEVATTAVELAQAGGARQFPPSPSATPYAFQAKGAAWLCTHARAVLADELGLGKACQVIIAARMLATVGRVRSALIACPAGRALHWAAKVEEWWPGGAIRIVPFEQIAEDTHAPPEADVVIVDESWRGIQPAFARLWRGPRHPIVWALMSTFPDARRDELWAWAQWADPTKRPPSELPELRKQLAPLFLRRTIDDSTVQAELPDTMEQPVLVELTPAQRRSYDDALSEGVEELQARGDTVTLTQVFDLLHKLRQICNFEPQTGESGKLNVLRAELAQVTASGRRAAVFSHFTSDRFGVRRLAEELKPNFDLLQFHSGVPPEQRDSTRRNFLKLPGGVLLLSYAAAHEFKGLRAASYVYLFDRWWNPAADAGPTRRARAGMARAVVIVRRLVCRDTIEEKIVEILGRSRRLPSVLAHAHGPDPGGSLSEEQIFNLLDLRVRPRARDVFSTPRDVRLPADYPSG